MNTSDTCRAEAIHHEPAQRFNTFRPITCPISDVIQAHEKANGHWFSPGAARFFSSRWASVGYLGRCGFVYFVDSTKYDASTPRLYTIRIWDPERPREIETVGEFQQYASSAAANRAAAQMAEWSRSQPED